MAVSRGCRYSRGTTASMASRTWWVCSTQCRRSVRSSMLLYAKSPAPRRMESARIDPARVFRPAVTRPVRSSRSCRSAVHTACQNGFSDPGASSSLSGRRAALGGQDYDSAGSRTLRERVRGECSDLRDDEVAAGGEELARPRIALHLEGAARECRRVERDRNGVVIRVARDWAEEL